MSCHALGVKLAAQQPMPPLHGNSLAIHSKLRLRRSSSVLWLMTCGRSCQSPVLAHRSSWPTQRKRMKRACGQPTNAAPHSPLPLHIGNDTQTRTTGLRVVVELCRMHGGAHAARVMQQPCLPCPWSTSWHTSGHHCQAPSPLHGHYEYKAEASWKDLPAMAMRRVRPSGGIATSHGELSCCARP